MHQPHASARTINPEAGEHAISAHPGEQAAAEAATRLSWKEFPYYPKRYGERGWKFSLTDSGWMQTLTDLSLDAAKSQVLWLSNVLAARGMPRYLLERHLEHLHAQLIVAVPERAQAYELLRGLVAYLRDMRLAQLPEPAFSEVSSTFEAAVASCPDKVRNMGVVLAAAVADDAGGTSNVLDSVKKWATDLDRFGPEWIQAVQATMVQARAALLR
jgi:hypothetical protein